MRIAIYGAGKCGEYIYKEIKMCRNSKIECSLFIDNNSDYYRGRKYDKPVVKLDCFINSYRKSVDYVFIAVSDMFVAQDMVVSLLNNDYDKIYLMPEWIWEARLPVLNVNGNFRSYIKNYNFFKPCLRYLEYHVSDYCNLKCKRCGHYSNLVTEKTFPNIGEFQESLNGLSKKFKNIRTFRLMGGEPFVNPDMDLYIYKVRDIFPYADIRIVSNGLLFPKVNERTVNSIKECGAIIDISQYPPTRDKIEDILEFLDENQLKYTIGREVKQFFSQLSENGSENLEKSFSNCCSKTCHFLRRNRLHPCPSVALTYENREFLNLDISEEIVFKNSFDLINGKESGWEMLKKMFSPNDFCGYCTDMKWYKWSISKDIKKEDYFVK